MPGLSFLNAAFLAGIVAAALPILIHLFSRRKAPRLDWSSTRFLRELNRQRIRRVKLRQLLLLALRALAVILFAVAMGRPALTGGWVLGGKAPSTAVILLDTSYSMGAMRGELPGFDLARRRAGEILDLLGEGDEAYLVTAGGEAESFTPYAVQDLGLIREYTAKLAPSHRAGGMGEGLALAARLLRGSKNLNRELYVVSDLQRSAWSAVGDSTTQDLGLPAEAAVCVTDLGDQVVDNLAIDDVTVEQGAVGRGRGLLVKVSNHTGRAQSSVPVRAFLGERAAGEVFADMEPGATAEVRIELAAGPGSESRGRVQIPEDALAVDDVRYFVLDVDRRAGVGIVGDLAPGGGDDFVRLALAPDAATSRFDVRMIPATALPA
ncbi:MAG TPA: BatA domain-containing protein, partial [Candidatus Udaeobacter sp.]|nr:BatA domain-containing protein [Candidatus Udaeobacter sp.]